MNTLDIRASLHFGFMVKCGTFMTSRSDDYLWQLLSLAPAAWALIRANEIRALDRVTFKPPVLDVGCGDGLVAKLILSKRKKKFDWGIDISEREIERARKSGGYKRCRIANVYNLPFEDQTFTTVFSNSVIEHIPDLDKALSEIARVLKNRGQLIVTVPSSYLTKYLWGTQNLGRWYGVFFNSIFKHHNLYTHKQWEKILAKHNLKLINYSYYHTKEMIQVHELLSFLSIPQHIYKFIFGHWPTLPFLRKIFIMPWLYSMLRPLYLEDTKKDQGGSVLLTAEKLGKKEK